MSGLDQELVFPGGEVAFVTKLLHESYEFKDRVVWFTTLLSKGTSLKLLQAALDSVTPRRQLIIPMHHGNKTTRILCWTYQS